MQTQKRAIILSASAGSGKTYQLAYKYVKDVITRPELYRGILAITFTNKATEEMKSRILREIHILASNAESDYLEDLKNELGFSEQHIRDRAHLARTNILHDYSRFSVLTIDRFCQRIIRAFLKELDIDMDYNIELKPDELLGRGADALIERIKEDAELRQWMLTFAQERLDDGMKWDMRGDLAALGQELFKGHHRGRNQINKGELMKSVSALRQRAKAVREEIKRCAEQCCDIIHNKFGLAPSDFKGGERSFVYAILRYANGEFKAPTKTMYEAAADPSKWYTAAASSVVRSAAIELQPILAQLCQTYDDGITVVNTAKLFHDNYRSFALLSDLYGEVELLCSQENTKLLGETKHLLSSFVNDSNTPFIYEKVGNRYEHYMIDEFQDTAEREWHNLKPLLQNAMASNEDTSVLIVGDVKQSIYRWRGGDWRLLKDVAYRDLGKEDTLLDSLEKNYRSLEKVITFNNKLIGNIVKQENDFLNNILQTAFNQKHIDEQLYAEYKDVAELAYADVEQKQGRKSENDGYAEVCIYEGKVSPFIEVIEDAISRGYRYSDILILARGRTDGKRIAKALFDYKQQKFSSKGEVGFNILTLDSLTIEGCDITEFIIATLRLAVNPKSDIERGVYNRYLGLPLGHTFSEDELSYLRHTAHLSPAEAFESIVEHFKLNERTDRIAYLQAMHEQVVSFSTTRIADIQNYLKWWDERGHEANLTVEMSDNTIEIMTIHKAKGLERPVVIVPYCKWDAISRGDSPSIVWATADTTDESLASIGEFPVAFNSNMKESLFHKEYYREFVMSHIDMLNMLYVAVTRASSELYLFAPKPPKSSSGISGVGPLVANAAASICENFVVETRETGSITRYMYGTKIAKHKPKAAKEDAPMEVILDKYHATQPATTLYHRKRPHIDEESYSTPSARMRGIMLHRIFEKAADINSVYRAIDGLERDCIIDLNDANILKQQIELMLDNPIVHEWFTHKWSDVNNESWILDGKALHRPDRVMIDGGRVVVVDYKFGEHKSSAYTRKVKEYMTLLGDMGLYSRIEGYVWYVALGEVDKV